MAYLTPSQNLEGLIEITSIQTVLSSFKGEKKNSLFKAFIEWNPMSLRAQSPGNKSWKSWDVQSLVATTEDLD